MQATSVTFGERSVFGHLVPVTEEKMLHDHEDPGVEEFKCGNIAMSALGRDGTNVKRKSNVRIESISRLLFPAYGSCGCCRTSWVLIRLHNTVYETKNTEYPGNVLGSGEFARLLSSESKKGVGPLCERCWEELSTA